MKRTMTICVPLIMFAATVDLVHQMYKGYAVLTPEQKNRLLTRLESGRDQLTIELRVNPTTEQTQAVTDLEAGQLNRFTNMFEEIYRDCLKHVRVNLKKSIASYQMIVNNTINTHAETLWKKYNVGNHANFIHDATNVLTSMLQEAGLWKSPEGSSLTEDEWKFWRAFETSSMIIWDRSRFSGHRLTTHFVIPKITERFYTAITENVRYVSFTQSKNRVCDHNAPNMRINPHANIVDDAPLLYTR